MRALILDHPVTDAAAADSSAGRQPDLRPGRPLDRHLQALAAAGFREVVVASSCAARPPARGAGEGAGRGLRLRTCSGIGPQGEGIEEAMPLLGLGPFALIFARVRTDYPFTRLRAVKCDWAHLVLVPLQAAGQAPVGAARFSLQGARVVAGRDEPAAPTKESRFPSFASGENRLRSTACHKRTTPLVPLAALDLPNRGRRVAFGSFAGIAVCHPRLFAEARGTLLERFRQAARDHLVTAEIWRGHWDEPAATG